MLGQSDGKYNLFLGKAKAAQASAGLALEYLLTGSTIISKSKGTPLTVTFIPCDMGVMRYRAEPTDPGATSKCTSCKTPDKRSAAGSRSRRTLVPS